MNYTGTIGNDSFGGTSGDDNIHGLDGDDSLSGGDGNDFIEGGAGNDIITGGPGSDDHASWMDASNPVHIDLLNGLATGWGNDTVTGIETVLASDYDDTIRGSSGADFVYAWDGDDTVRGDAGNDELNGGTGNDTLEGEGGDDRLWSGQGDDVLDGGGGNDAVLYLGSTSGVLVDLAAGTASDGQGGSDILIGVEYAYGSSYADTLLGGSGNEFFSGGMGDDTIEGNAGHDGLVGDGGNDYLDGGDGGGYFLGGEGDDTLIGGQGVDLAQYTFDPAGVTVNLLLGTATDGHGDADVLSGIENIFGTDDYGDFLHGDAGDNYIWGDGGDDTIWGGDGFDALDGGDGTDLAGFTGDFADYQLTVREDGAIEVAGVDGTSTLYRFELLQFGATVMTVQEGTEEPDEIEGSDEDDVIRGLGGNDRLSGNGGDDLLDGGEGADTMEGGEGNDTYIVDDDGDRVIEPDSILDDDGPPQQVGVGAGIDRVIAGINYTLGNAVENLELAAGSGAASGTGNALPNTITGNGNDNRLTGAGGNDTLDGGDGIDTAAYAGTRGQYTVSAASVDGTAAGDGVDSLAAIERLDFSDIDVALDLDGHAGEVAKVIGVVFGQPVVSNEVYAGIGLRLADEGTDYDALMQLALDIVLGPEPTNAQVVTLLYTNVVGVAPDAATRDYFVGWIEGGAVTQLSLALLAADVMGLPAAAISGLAYI